MDLFAPRHLLIILAIALLVFGTKKLKTLGSDLGGAVKGFKQAMKDGESEDHAAPEPQKTESAVQAAIQNGETATKPAASAEKGSAKSDSASS